MQKATIEKTKRDKVYKLSCVTLLFPSLSYPSKFYPAGKDEEAGYGVQILLDKDDDIKQKLETVLDKYGKEQFGKSTFATYILDGDNQPYPGRSSHPNPKEVKFGCWYLKAKSKLPPVLRSVNGQLTDGSGNEFYSGVMADVWVAVNAYSTGYAENPRIVVTKLVAVQKRADGEQLAAAPAYDLDDSEFRDWTQDDDFDITL